jgi:single-strand DNA-binding protein
MQVAIVGRLQTRTWDDNEGKRHYITEVVADETYFADSKREQKGDSYEGDGYFPLDEQKAPWEA